MKKFYASEKNIYTAYLGCLKGANACSLICCTCYGYFKTSKTKLIHINNNSNENLRTSLFQMNAKLVIRRNYNSHTIRRAEPIIFNLLGLWEHMNHFHTFLATIQIISGIYFHLLLLMTGLCTKWDAQSNMSERRRCPSSFRWITQRMGMAAKLRAVKQPLSCSQMITIRSLLPLGYYYRATAAICQVFMHLDIFLGLAGKLALRHPDGRQKIICRF